MRRWILYLMVPGIVLWGAAPASASADRSIAVHLLGLYDSPMKPSSKASLLTDGFGFQFLPELQLNSFFGLGMGFSNEYLYRPGGNAMRVGTFDFAASIRVPSRGLRPQPYAQIQYGLNTLSKSGNHWRGSDRVAFVLGTRLPMGFGLGLDLGVRQVFLLPRPNDLQCVSIHWGMVSEFNLKHGGNNTAPKPKETAVFTLSPTATPTVTLEAPRSTPTNIPSSTQTATETTIPVERQKTSQLAATPTPTLPTIITTPTVEASARMLDLYEKGIEEYKTNRFEMAIVHLKGALAIKDAKVEYWYYAEANAMLGVLYHYHKTIPGHLETARKYYRTALTIDPATATAKKGLKALNAIAPSAGKLKK
jgi:tetratricopeptide (TPR) repeat protein